MTTGKTTDEVEIVAGRGVADAEEAREWLDSRRIEDIECIVPDLAGVARGKMMPVAKFLANPTMTLPASIFAQTISGEYPPDGGRFLHNPTDSDLLFEPDFATLTRVPWETDPTAQLIHDALHKDGRPVETAPRQVLRRVIGLYAERGWLPVVAPEIEFYLIKPNIDPDYPLEPPVGRSGRPEVGRQSYSISALNEFDEVIDDIYRMSAEQGLEIDTLSHEEGAAQMEINLRHGDPLELADQVFLFKRTIRECALRHDMYATFMAKPMEREPGSSMHIHQSVVDLETGRNIFAGNENGASDPFQAFIAGHQTYLPDVTSIMAPYVNSYRRLRPRTASPINLAWGHDNRTVSLRVPDAPAQARRLENRLPSSDANPYLAIAASLACGWLGMVEGLRPSPPTEGSGRDLPADLPLSLPDALARLDGSEKLQRVLGDAFVITYCAVKQAEYETFMDVISPWEREHLLLNV